MTTPASGTPGLLARLQYPLLTLALLIFLILGWRGRTPINIGSVDEHVYVMLSRALESGSYREIYLTNAPLHKKYPPGWPAVLAVMHQVGGVDLDLVRAFNLLALAASILFMFLIVRRVAGVGLALSLAFLLAINHVLLNSGGTVLSESLFVGLAAAALYLTVRADEGRDRLVYWAIAVALAAFLTRTAGITIVAAVGVWLLSRRRRPELVTYAVASLMVVGGWLLYTALVPDQVSGFSSYGRDIVTGLSPRPGSSSNPVLSVLRKAAGNLTFYGLRNVPGGLAEPTIPGMVLDNVAWLVANAVLISVGTFVFWRRARAVAAYLLLYVGLLLAWPWLQSRLLVPLFPLAMTALLVGAHHLTRARPARVRQAVVGALVLLLAIGGLKATLERDALNRKCDLANPYESEGCFDPVIRGVGRAAVYMRDHIPKDAVVLTEKNAGIYYESGRLTDVLSILSKVPPDQALQRLRDRRIQYVLLSGRHISMIRMGARLLPSCTRLRVVKHFAPEVSLLTTEVAGATSEDGCSALDALANSGPE